MKKKFIFIIGVALLSSYSCQKSLLSPVSQTQVSDQGGQPFATSDRIVSQVLGLYRATRNGNTFSGRYQIYNDVKADNWINSSANSVTAYQTWTETVGSTSSEVLNLWNYAYAAINDANLFIDGMATYGNKVVSSTLSANYIAEAKFLRALNYYALVEMYCQPYVVNAGASPGLPLRLKGNSQAGNFDLAPSTVAQVFTQILADLNDAEKGLPASYADATTNTTRAHVNTAIALKTRVYLAMQQYANVITEANKIVSAAAPFKAPSGVANALQADVTTVFTNYTTTESVFSFPFNTTTETPGSQSALGDYYYNMGKPGTGEFFLNPQGVIADPNWKATDKRRSFIYQSTININKYLTKWSLPSPYPDWAPVIRYAEVILNLAEARARLTPLDPQAIALLNAIRGRSDASTVYTTASFASGDDLIAAIMQERNIELLGEGFKWADLWRLDQPIPAKGSVKAVAPTDPNYIWPMSGNEQQYNKLIGR
ncbi:MAG TPA: RagB/SusD family nutrient uptake outer membrane protein [Mucilaginibacter sp.]